jgi:hypothetical protein
MIDRAQQYLDRHKTFFADLKAVFDAITNALFSSYHLEQSRLRAGAVLEKHRFELETLVPGVLGTGLCEAVGPDGRRSVGIEVRVAGWVSLPQALEGVPLIRVYSADLN